MKANQKTTAKMTVRIALLSALMVSALTAASVFLGVNAAADDVSPTDVALVQELSDEVIVIQDDETDGSDDSVVGEFEGTTPDLIEFTVDDASDFITNQFVDSAWYDGSFYSELKDVEKLVYDGYVANLIDKGSSSKFTVNLANSDIDFTFDASSYNAKKDTFSDSTALSGVKDLIISSFAAFYYDHPEIYWMRSFQYEISYVCSDNVGHLKTVTITPKVAYTDALSEVSTVNKGISTAVSSIRQSRSSTSRYDTVYAIHSYVCMNAAYDYTALQKGATSTYGYAYTAAPLFTSKKKFVCEGYAKSFKILCDRFNIPCVLVFGNGIIGEYSEAHMWNYVQMEDGKWYGVDATWDDCGDASPYLSYFLVGSNTTVRTDVTFGENHVPNKQVMVTKTMAPLAYPALSANRYQTAQTATSLTMQEASVDMKIGETHALALAIEPSNFSGRLTCQTSDPTVVTIGSSGVLKAVGIGTATVTVTLGDFSVSCEVNVTRSVTLSKSKLTLIQTASNVAPTATLSVKITGSTVGYQWYSEDESVATVTSGGKVTAVGEGTTKIYCATDDGVTSDPCAVTVDSFMITSSEENIISNIAYLQVNDDCQLNVSAAAHGNITWKSSNTSIASINSTSGVVKGLKKGTVTLTATAADKSKLTIRLTVVNPSTSLSLNSTKPNIYVNGTTTLKATLSKNSNDPVFWSSDDTSVATVTAKGVVKGLKQGTATITATTFSGATATALVTVRTKATAVKWEQVTPALFVGDTVELKAAITAPADCNDSIVWSTSNKKIASFVSAGENGYSVVIKGAGKGTATITAKTGSGKKITYKLTVVNSAADSIQMSKTALSLYTGYSTTVKAQVLPKTSNDFVTWRSDNPEIATVDQKGKIKGIAQGTAVIYAESFGGKSASVEVTVRTKAKSVSVDKTAAIIKVGETAEVNVTAIAPADSNDTLTWTTSSKTIASLTVSSDGKTATVTGLKKGTATITVKTGSGKSQRIKVTVTG